MWLDWLELVDIRSYRKLQFRPDSGVHLLLGRNGAGKTNLLEAISYLSRLRSFRHAPADKCVGMIFPNHSAIRLLQVIIGNRPIDPQNQIWIRFFGT